QSACQSLPRASPSPTAPERPVWPCAGLALVPAPRRPPRESRANAAGTAAHPTSHLARKVPLMPDVVFHVDQSKSMRDQDVPGHNRWHPDIPSAAFVQPGSEFRVECREWTDAQLGNNDSANDVRDVDLTHAHMLSGPIEVQGAEPGDLLVVDILDLGPVPQETGPAPGQGWGYTGIFAKTNAGGFLTDYYPDAYKAIWDFHGQEATSRHLPGIRYTGITHPGLFAPAPSAELLARGTGGGGAAWAPDPAGPPPLALPPREESTLAGTLSGAAMAKVAREGARTVPARENGGNHDIKNWTRG